MFNESHFQKKKLKKNIYLFRLFIEKYMPRRSKLSFLLISRLVIGASRTVGSAKKFVRITSGFGGGEFTKTLRKVCTSQAHGAWISFPPPPFSLLPPPLFSKFSYKSFLFQNFHNHSFFLHLTISVDVIHHE